MGMNTTVIATEALWVWRFSYALECPPFTESGWVNVLAHNGEEAHRKLRERIRVGKLELGEPVPVLELTA